MNPEKSSFVGLLSEKKNQLMIFWFIFRSVTPKWCLGFYEITKWNYFIRSKHVINPFPTWIILKRMPNFIYRHVEITFNHKRHQWRHRIPNIFLVFRIRLTLLFWEIWIANKITQYLVCSYFWLPLRILGPEFSQIFFKRMITSWQWFELCISKSVSQSVTPLSANDVQKWTVRRTTQGRMSVMLVNLNLCVRYRLLYILNTIVWLIWYYSLYSLDFFFHFLLSNHTAIIKAKVCVCVCYFFTLKLLNRFAGTWFIDLVFLHSYSGRYHIQYARK